MLPREADHLAAAVDGDNGIQRNYSTDSQGRRASSIFPRNSTRGVDIVEYRLIIFWLRYIVEVNYRISGNIGDELNLAVWRTKIEPPN